MVFFSYSLNQFTSHFLSSTVWIRKFENYFDLRQRGNWATITGHIKPTHSGLFFFFLECHIFLKNEDRFEQWSQKADGVAGDHGEILNWEEVIVRCAFQRQRLDAETHLLSVLKLSLQGRTVFKVADKVGVLKAQLDFLERWVDRGVCETLQTLAGSLRESGAETSISQLLANHLDALVNFPTSEDPRLDKEEISHLFVNVPKDFATHEEDMKLLETENWSDVFEIDSLAAFCIRGRAWSPECTIVVHQLWATVAQSWFLVTVTATVTKCCGVDISNISNTLRVSSAPITTRWDPLELQAHVAWPQFSSKNVRLMFAS